jgi:hypothetical protein
VGPLSLKPQCRTGGGGGGLPLGFIVSRSGIAGFVWFGRCPSQVITKLVSCCVCSPVICVSFEAKGLRLASAFCVWVAYL